jgi:DNA-binding MarR family transcriptional regulator
VKVLEYPFDRRSRLLELTREGEHLLAEAIPVWERTHGEVEQAIPDGNAEELRKGLRALA